MKRTLEMKLLECQGDGSLDTFEECRCQGDGSLDNFCNTHKTVKYIILPMDFGCSAGVSISRSPNGATFFVFAEP